MVQERGKLRNASRRFNGRFLGWSAHFIAISGFAADDVDRPLPALTRRSNRTSKANSEGSTTVPRRAGATQIQPESSVLESCSFAMPYKQFTKMTQATGLKNIGAERTLSGLLGNAQVNSLTRITLENNGKIRLQPDRENAFARASGGGNATAVEPSMVRKILILRNNNFRNVLLFCLDREYRAGVLRAELNRCVAYIDPALTQKVRSA